MPRATTKTDLLKMANEQFDKLWKMIDSMNGAEQSADFCFDAESLTQKDGAAHWKRDKNLRDVLIHLYEWHQLVLTWVAEGERGEARPFLPPGITWANYQKMNAGFFEKHKGTAYYDAKRMLKDSHAQVVALMERYSDEELFVKFPFKLSVKSSIAEYNMIHELLEQVDWNCTLLEEVRECIQSPEELQRFEAAINDNKKVMEKAKQTLESLKTTETVAQ
jgi:hypothetical protein